MSKCGVFSPAATDAELAFVPAEIEGAPGYASRSGAHVGRLRGMVFVGAPVGNDDWVAEELELKFVELVRRLPAGARAHARLADCGLRHQMMAADWGIGTASSAREKRRLLSLPDGAAKGVSETAAWPNGRGAGQWLAAYFYSP